MFLTFKNNQPARDEDLDPGMEQVAALRAGPATPRGPVRALRRPACIACQAKKARCPAVPLHLSSSSSQSVERAQTQLTKPALQLRCTGSERRCERCLSHSLACIFPPPKPKAQHRGRGRLGGAAGGSARSGHLAQEDDQTIRVDQEAATATATATADSVDAPAYWMDAAESYVDTADMFPSPDSLFDSQC
jgi:hypothetical protein